MANSVQIKVNLEELKNSEKALGRLSKSMASRHLRITMNEAKGAVADNLLLAEKQLNDIGTTLAELIQKTQAAVVAAEVAFTESEKKNAQRFGASEG